MGKPLPKKIAKPDRIAKPARIAKPISKNATHLLDTVVRGGWLICGTCVWGWLILAD